MCTYNCINMYDVAHVHLSIQRRVTYVHVYISRCKSVFSAVARAMYITDMCGCRFFVEPLHAAYEEFTRLAETRLAQNSLNDRKMCQITLKLLLNTLKMKLV